MSIVNIRALIVEDNVAWQQILSELLTDAGLEVDVADSLETAVESLRSAAHRLAVVDLSLSGDDPENRDGLRVLEAARRLDPGCATVLLTGFATVELAVTAMGERGALSCLRKETFNRAEFRQLIDRALAAAPAAEGQQPSTTAGAPAGAATPAEEPAAGLALVVEDDAGWRSILSELLTEAGYRVRACGGFGEALGCLRRERYDLAVVDLALEGAASAAASATAAVAAGARFWERGLSGETMDGYRLLASVRAGGTPAIVVSGVAGAEEIERAYAEHGIFAFVQKQAFDRRAFLQIAVEAQAAAGASGELDILTAREQEVLALLAQGMTNKEIARELFISTNTVKRHLKSIFEKLDVHTRSAAAARAVEAGIEVERRESADDP